MDRPVTLENYKEGARVRRGPDWRWDNQDCDKNGKRMSGILGKVDRYNLMMWVEVKWDKRVEFYCYRLYEKDLVYVDESQQLELDL